MAVGLPRPQIIIAIAQWPPGARVFPSRRQIHRASVHGQVRHDHAPPLASAKMSGVLNGVPSSGHRSHISNVKQRVANSFRADSTTATPAPFASSPGHRPLPASHDFTSNGNFAAPQGCGLIGRGSLMNSTNIERHNARHVWRLSTAGRGTLFRASGLPE
jgi:hypothetical protein